MSSTDIDMAEDDQIRGGDRYSIDVHYSVSGLIKGAHRTRVPRVHTK